MHHVRNVATGVALVAAIGLSAATRADWLDQGDANRELLDAVSSAVSGLPAGTRFLLVDHSGDFGDVYSYLPGLLPDAVSEALDRDIAVEICTADGVTRHHPDAARYPIATTQYCSAALPLGEGSIVKQIEVEGDSLTLGRSRSAADDSLQRGATVADRGSRYGFAP